MYLFKTYIYTNLTQVDNRVTLSTCHAHLLFLFCAPATERRSLRRRRADAAVRVLPEVGAQSRRAAARRRQQERLLLERCEHACAGQVNLDARLTPLHTRVIVVHEVVRSFTASVSNLVQ